ncbi:hypothetical protein AUJ14_00695 [Candidatus Micrarchaeota archaeon CG1_02_55_22]|nr:MAG: hypothetical protein AUJ14_00695 [Candidatus Micrarchaeota archaeon CG1_02_55_22]
MIVPATIRAFNPKTRKYEEAKVKVTTTKIKPGRKLAWGSRRHARKLAGNHGKVKGKAKVKKQGIRNKIMLTFASGYKIERVISGRMKKKAEVKR